MLDILYLAWNRLEMTCFSFEMLLRNTDWTRVNSLQIYDDGSTDGTREFLLDQMRSVPCSCLFLPTEFRSPVAIMNDYLGRSDAAMFAKIDNDIVVPPGWLGHMLDVMDRNPPLDLLGMEAGRTRPPAEHPGWMGMYGWSQTKHIGGVGVMRTECFRRLGLPKANGRWGFTEWQAEMRPRRGWITPDLLVCSLDMIPTEPWVTLSARYKKEGWQRGWPTYDDSWPDWWKWWDENPGSEDAA
jgi:glycosyl transferase family 2